MHVSDLDDLHAYYARGEEAARLDTPFGSVEFERTKQILQRALPKPPAVVADIGGGPGRYAEWLASLGYRVEHSDIVGSHVQQVQQKALAGVHSRVSDARHLDLADAEVDAVLLLGPLYHLTERADRLQVLREAKRVVKPGGPVFAAAISRWAPRLHGMVSQRIYEGFPRAFALLEEIEESGRMSRWYENDFSGYTHRPHELAEEVGEAGLELEDLVGVEGIAFAFDDLEQRLADPANRAVILDAAEKLERVPELLGLSPHMVATARRPD